MVARTDKKDSTVEHRYLTLVRQTISGAGKGAEIKTDTGKPGTDLTIIVTPRNPGATNIELDIADKDFVFLHAGLGTTFEIPSGGGVNLPLGQIEQIRALMRAIMDGKLEEQLTYRGPTLVAGKSILHLDKGDVSMSWKRLTLRSLKSQKTRNHILYESYM